MVMEEESDCDSSDDSDMTGEPDSVDPEWFPPEDIEEEDDYMEELLPGASPQHQKYVVDEERLLNLFTIYLQKKLAKLAGLKKFALVAEWMRSILYHLYWCAATSEGDADMLEARWKSMCNHIANIHVHENPLFAKCKHGPIKRKWFEPGTEVYEKLTDILLSKRFMKSVRKLSPDSQTSSLEGYHATIIYFAPKMYHFGYATMISRLQLAALHFNENGGRDQAKGKHGVLQFNIAYPKYKKMDGYSLKRVLTKCTFGYVRELQTELYQMVRTGTTFEPEKAPPPLSSLYQHPSKQEVIEQHKELHRYKEKMDKRLT
ncbi:hypothetical protein CesoFtcFv8_008940 [Champsocephalus esox]|uniref:Uncharacterized protein n=1 Tax=Champsocephalus esox TaxID=159716 RepID=A0AAN8CBK5_9TELE|nr:hypothetical protein CesoFtcFv8_008940 [Champsocephalus esox]